MGKKNNLSIEESIAVIQMNWQEVWTLKNDTRQYDNTTQEAWYNMREIMKSWFTQIDCFFESVLSLAHLFYFTSFIKKQRKACNET